MADAPAGAAVRTAGAPMHLFNGQFWWGLLLVLAVGLFTACPTLYLTINSFNIATPGNPFVFGFDTWRQVLTDPYVHESIGYTFLLSMRAPIGVTIAFVIAWLLVRIEIPGRKVIEYALWFAFFLPSLPLAVGWILLLDPNYGLLNDFVVWIGLAVEAPFSIYTVTGIMWVHLTLTVIPINVILLSPAIQQMDASFEEAALASGSGHLRTLRKVTLPLLLPAVFTAFIVGFIKSLEAFEIEQLLGTPSKINVFATTLYDYAHFDPPEFPQSMALSTFFLIILLGITMLYRLSMRYGEGHATITGKTSRMRSGAQPRWAYGASAAIFIYIAVGIITPIIVLVLGTFTKLFGFFFMKDVWTVIHWVTLFAEPSFRRSMVNSFVVSILAAGIGTLIYALLAWCIVRTKLWGREILNFLVWLPWAIPGILLGLSTLTFILNVPGFNALQGTLTALVVVLLVKEVPLGVQMLKTSILQIAPELEEAGGTSGAGFRMIFSRITLPLIAPMFGSVFILTFVAAFRDISATILLVGANSKTMAVLMIELAEEGRFEATAVVGVVLSFIVFLLTLAMNWLRGRVEIKS